MESISVVKQKIAKFREYLDYFERHYDNVQRAWALINEKCQNNQFRFIYDDFVWHSIDTAIKGHDESKLSPREFTQYRQYFFSIDGEEKNENAFNAAWNHHLENNEHHWETWVKMAASPYADVFVVQMVCDWVAMGFEFGDTAQEYYEKNKHKIQIPDWAEKLIYQIFECIYPLEGKWKIQ
jgi:hypothetical protein